MKMSIYKCNLLFLGFVLLSTIQEVEPQESLTCFKCSSKLSSTCDDPFNTSESSLTAECNYPENVCIKHIRKKTPNLRWNEERTFRGCGIPEHCRRFSEMDVEHCSVCFTPLCNSSNSLVFSPIILLFMYLSVLSFKYL